MMKNVQVNDGQSQAIEKIIAWAKLPYKKEDDATKTLRLTGLAGTGKTFVLSYVRQFLTPSEGVVYVAPTGRAANQLTLKGSPATTIHKLAYKLQNIQREPNKPPILTFRLRDELPEYIWLVVVDEASMVNEKMYRDLMSFGVKILFCGDAGQLPPVDKSNSGFSVLKRPELILTEIVRQALDNPIITLANDIYNGGGLKIGNHGGKVRITSSNKITDKHILNTDQILVWTNEARSRTNRQARELYGRFGNTPVVGDKLVCLKNAWETFVASGINLVNGVIGYCDEILAKTEDSMDIMFRADFVDEAIEVSVDLSVFKGRMPSPFSKNVPFDFGYAVTVHKAQGSEWDSVLVFVPGSISGSFKRQWLYTAMTRAKDKLVIGL